ncbi:MAG: hypothetical protein M3065_20860, partial [Actinomycetota bacterium]|nr:hypothetical protein [Actinomycetota bacterium]
MAPAVPSRSREGETALAPRGPGPSARRRPLAGRPRPWCLPGRPRGTPGEQTHPFIRPRSGRPHTLFVLRLTLGIAAGHVGVVATYY